MSENSVIESLLAQQRAANVRLYLVASENSPSITARLAFLTDIANRYYFPLKEYRHWAFPGNEIIEKIYERCRELLREVTGAKYVNIRPISGVSAMTIALAALARGGDTIATIAPANGGHTITAGIARRFGIRVVHLPYKETFTLDMEALPSFLAREKVSLIYLDQAQILFPYGIEALRAGTPAATKIYYDGSHVMGLIFGAAFEDPLRGGASFLGGSTHKTVPGPHKAFITTNDAEEYEKIERASKVFVSHDHAGDVAALALVLEEMRGRWPRYAAQVVKNAQALAQALDAKGLTVLASERGFTKSHQLWIDTAPHTDAFEAVLALARANIIVNTINAPGLADRLALRIGVQEATYCGATEATMEAIAEIFEAVLVKKSENEAELRARVAALKRDFTPSLDREALEKVLSALFGKS